MNFLQIAQQMRPMLHRVNGVHFMKARICIGKRRYRSVTDHDSPMPDIEFVAPPRPANEKRISLDSGDQTQWAMSGRQLDGRTGTCPDFQDAISRLDFEK